MDYHRKFAYICGSRRIKIQAMKTKTNRLETLKILLSSLEFGSQEEILKALKKEGFTPTQATLSRDLKRLKAAKAVSVNGKYVYVLPNETLYKRITTPRRAQDMLRRSGYLSIHFSGQLVVLKTRPGYASALAYDIDNTDLPCVLGTIAGDDTIFIATKETSTHDEIVKELSVLIPELIPVQPFSEG